MQARLVICMEKCEKSEIFHTANLGWHLNSRAAGRMEISMNYKQAMEYIEETGRYGSVPGLENIRNLCEKLGNPQDKLRFVHIAGTNGKGSTLAYISTILKEAGYRVGRYVSPTIFEYRERIQVNERMISKEALCRNLETIQKAVDGLLKEGKPHPTSFEIETAMAFLYFLEKKCDIVVLETGLGGTLDATNLITTTLVSVIASVSMDHMAFLGDSLTEIAENKAGIIKPGVPVVTMEQKEEVMEVLERKVKEQGSLLVIASGADASKVRYGVEKQKFHYKEYKDLEIHLAGKWQIANAVLATEAVRVLAGQGFPVKEQDIREGLKKTVWRGRFTVIAKKPLFIADGAHNEDAAQKLADSIRFYFTNKKIIYIIGILKDKEYEKIIASTAGLAEQIITVTTPANPRALPAYELAKAVKEYRPHVTAADSLQEAVEMSYLLADKDSVIIAFGSLSYLGELIKIVENRHTIRRDSHGRQEEN